jgi:regulation of enolase protein 1 (concanavalin A-like superfamily)
MHRNCRKALLIAGLLGLLASAPSPGADAPSTKEKDPKAAQALPGWGEAVDPEGDCKFDLDTAAGALTIVVPGKTHILSAELRQMKLGAPRVLADVRGDFEAKVRVVGAIKPSGAATLPRYAPYHGAGLLIWQDRDNYIRLERAGGSARGKATFYANYELRKEGKLAASHGLAIPDGPLFVRLQRRGPKVVGAISRDGKDWTELPPLEAELNERVKVGVLAVSSSAKPLKARLEGLRVAPIASEEPPAAKGEAGGASGGR